MDIIPVQCKTKDSDKTLGFSSGGDDYLAKPFSYSELISRVKALIRRYQVYRGKESDQIVPEKGTASLQYHDLQIEESKREVTSGGKLLELTDIEYEMLHLLVKHRGQIFSAERGIDVTKVKSLVTRIRQNMAAQLLLLILITGTCCILFFCVAWQNRLPILYYFTYQVRVFSAMDSDFQTG